MKEARSIDTITCVANQRTSSIELVLVDKTWGPFPRNPTRLKNIQSIPRPPLLHLGVVIHSAKVLSILF